MSFDFVSQLIDEVALEGLDGITLETLWTRVIKRKGFPLSVDAKSKKYLWKTLAGHPDLSFYELPEARPPLEYVNRFDFLDPDTGFWIETHLGADIYPLHIITGKADQGSCTTYDTRRDITIDIRDKPWDPKLTLEETVERYGDKLVVVASQAVRYMTLMGQEAKSSISLDDMEYCLLERIGRARSNGEVTTHTAITGSLGVFKIESKKLFYHCKKLIKLHLLTKQAFCIRDEKGKQLSCRLLQLRRFMCRIMSKNRTLLENVCRYLEGKDNHCEVTSILREELEMPENAFKRLVKDKTYLHLSDVPYREFYPDATEEEYLTKSMLKERNLKIIKLVKPFKGDLDEDEDEDEEDDKDGGKEVVEWVYERPLLQQALRQFERVGAQGLKQTHLQKLLRLPRLECRTVVRNLLKLGLLTSVMKSFGKQRTSILIATKFYNNSKLNQEFDKERSRLLEHLQVEPLSADDSMADVTDMETSMAEQTINTTMTQSTDVSMMDVSVSQSDSDLLRTPARSLGKRKHSSERTPSEGSPSGKSPKSIKSEGSLFDMKHLTALKLRRANKILDALKETKVFESVSAIYKMLLSTEAEEGSVEKMDRKTMTQLINWLKTSGKIKILKTVIQQEDKVMELEFVCSPEISPDDQIIKTFIEHAKMKNFAMKKKYSNKNPKSESLQELPPDLPASIRDSIMRFREYRSKLRNDEMVYDASAYTKYNFLPKIKRHQAVYNYLHYLLYSYDGQLIHTSVPSTSSDTTTELDQVESGMQSVFDQIEAMKEPPIYKDEMSWKRFLAPLQCNHGHGKGWCLMSDVLVLLPLVTFCQIVSLPYRIEGLVELLEHPTRRFYPVVSLPPIIRQQVLFARRYTQSFYDSCYQLALMGLLSFGPQVFKDKDKCFIYLQKRARLLDTRSSVMAYCKTWPVKEEGFTQQDYVLETDDDVHMYWCDLEVIALNSNLGYKGVLDKDGEVERGVKLEEALIPIQFEEDPPTHYLPGDRRGAAGFDSSLFLHLIRNWATQLTRRKKPEMPNEFVKKASKKRKRSLSVQETNEGGKLKFLSTSLSQRIPKLASKQKLGLMGPTSVEGGTKTRKVRGNRGGKGVRKKLQDPQTIGRGKKNTKIPKLRTSIRTSSHMRKIRAKKKPEEKIRKRLYDEVDQSALDMMIQERVTWTPHEDTIILLCKTASLLLGRFRRGMVVPWTVVRDILHEAVPESRDKTSTACQRRVAFGMKNPQTMMSVSIYLGEVHQDKAIMERFGSFQYKSVDKNTPTIFKECVKMLINKFTSDDEEKIILPSTLSELDENYIVKVVGPITNKVPIEDVEKERDVYYYTLQNLIHSYIAAQRDKQGRIHEMYRLFKQYPDDLLARVFSDMHKMGLITKVKNDYSTQSIKKRQFATAVTLKKLTQKYYYSFFSRYPTNMFTQSYAMLDKIVNVFTEGPKDSIELTGNLQGGHVATICGLFAMKKLDFCVRIPEDILIVDHVGLVQYPPGRGKIKPSNPSAPQPSTSSAPSPPPMCTPTVVGGNEMEVVEEVEVSAVTDSDQYMEATHGSVVPEPQTLESIETSMKRRNCRSLIIIEGDVSVGEQLLNRVPTRNASRSLLSLCRNKILSSVDVKSSNVQDHFVINSCDVKVALHLSSSATAAGGSDGRLSEREMEETKGLFLKQQKAKEMYRKHLQYFPFHLDLSEVWEDLGMEYGTDDVIMIKKVYETIDTAGPIGVRESDIKNEYKAVCNISLVIMVLLEQKADVPARRKRQYRPYSPTQMKNAYIQVVEKGCSVYKAAKMYSVPEQTLRDRTKGITSPECLSSGPGPLLSQEEEARLASHLKLMASIGYGYTRAQVISLGTEYAITLNKRTKQDSSLSLQWFYSFMGRWPDLKLRRPRTLTQLRATATSEESVERYFSHLEEVLDKYQLKSSPELIYNVDEKGINLTHAAPQVVGSSTEVPLEICPEKSSTVTVLGCGNALGQKIPPFFIFPGARMRDDLLEGSSVGTSGTVSESGWSNSEIFQRWLTKHFTRYANVGGERKVLLLYDGHRSHITPSLIDFAVTSGIILFVLPPHTSHVLQPMDVGCFGPFTKIFCAECRRWQRSNSGTVNRYSVCALACKSYELSLSSNNLQSAFRKCGIFPFDPTAIDRSFLKPSTFAKEQNEKPSEKSDVPAGTSNNFFNDHLPIVTIKQSKPRRSIHKIVGGQAITEPAISTQVVEYVSNSKKQTPKQKEKATTGKLTHKKTKSTAGKLTNTSSRPSPTSTSTSGQNRTSPKPGPSGIDKMLISDSSDSDMSDTENDKCCVCGKFQPDELRRCPHLEFTKWGQCTFRDCGHWVHLKYCCTSTFLRRHDEFHCPCHQEE